MSMTAIFGFAAIADEHKKITRRNITDFLILTPSMKNLAIH
jgi:hypothetical protein